MKLKQNANLLVGSRPEIKLKVSKYESYSHLGHLKANQLKYFRVFSVTIFLPFSPFRMRCRMAEDNCVKGTSTPARSIFKFWGNFI